MESKEEEKFGTKFSYEKGFDGPVKVRSCTDVLCLALFVGIMIAWAYAIVQALLLGDPILLECLINKNSSECGSIQLLNGKPVLYISDVKQCKSINSSKCSTCMTKKVPLKDCQSWFAFDTKEKETHSFESRNIGTLAFVGNSTAFKSVENTQTETKKDNNTRNYNTDKLPGFTFPLNTITPATANFLKKLSFVSESFDDLMKTWSEIIMFWGMAIIACFLYLAVIYFFLPKILWVSIIGLSALLIFGATLAILKFLYYDESVTEADDSEIISSYMWLAIGVICLALVVILIVLLIALRKHIKIAVILITEACRCLRNMFLTVIFPLLPVLLQLTLTVIFVVTLMYLYTSIPIHNEQMMNDANEATHESKMDSTLCIVYYSINIFSYFWSICFVSATSDLILAGVFCTWYWAPDKSHVHNTELLFSNCRTLRYHLGTAAFGGLVIAIFRCISILLQQISNRLKALSSFCSMLMWPLRCIVWILENFLNYVNRNAYIMCALHGSNYMVSAKNGYNLLMRNILRVIVLNNIISFIVILGKLLVAIGVSVAAYYYFERLENSRMLYNSVIPTLFVTLGSFIVAHHFFNLLQMATDTIFLCFLEDCERNDGSLEKPFYMSSKMKEILEKHENS